MSSRTFISAPDAITGSYPESIAVGDFNGDGKVDFATVSYFGRTVSVRLGQGDGTFRSVADVALSGSDYNNRTSVADVNGNGKADRISKYSDGRFLCTELLVMAKLPCSGPKEKAIASRMDACAVSG